MASRSYLDHRATPSGLGAPGGRMRPWPKAIPFASCWRTTGGRPSRCWTPARSCRRSSFIGGLRWGWGRCTTRWRTWSGWCGCGRTGWRLGGSRGRGGGRSVGGGAGGRCRGLWTDGRRRTPGELRGLLDESCDELLAEVGRRPLEQVETRERNGRTFQFTRGAILTHVTTHGTHHRAQCLNMLRHLGVSPLPASSVAEWTWLGEAAG